jgi:TRAP-type C4-dicarboxylate transport system substrate-binding protein
MRNLIFAIALAAALPAPDVAYAADPVQLKFGFPVPPMSFVNRRGVTPWIKDLEAAAQGTLEIKLFAGPTLGTVRN